MTEKISDISMPVRRVLQGPHILGWFSIKKIAAWNFARFIIVYCSTHRKCSRKSSVKRRNVNIRRSIERWRMGFWGEDINEMTCSKNGPGGRYLRKVFGVSLFEHGSLYQWWLANPAILSPRCMDESHDIDEIWQGRYRGGEWTCVWRNQ